MASILYKWFFSSAVFLMLSAVPAHPVYVSVTDIEHNAKEETLEVSCKLFTADFEKVLRSTFKTHVDLINPSDRSAMDKLINIYVQKHLSITADGKPVTLKYLGYEVIEEAVYSYYEAGNIKKPKSIELVNDLLYEFHSEQMGFMHISVDGNRKSTRLNNPDDKVAIQF